MARRVEPHAYQILTPQESEAVGLPRFRYGLLLCVDAEGKRVTYVGDASYVEMLRDLSATDNPAPLELPEGTMPLLRKGWPRDWGTS